MQKNSFDFYPKTWLSDKSLRSCSVAARGFWVDLLCLMYPTGHLLINGKPIDEKQLARLTGEKLAMVRKMLKELGDAGIYQAGQEVIYSEDIVDSTIPLGGVIDHRREIELENAPKEHYYDLTHQLIDSIDSKKSSDKFKRPSLAKAALDWWRTEAGWVRYGEGQAVSMLKNESIEEYRYRVSKRIPPGPHLESLPPHLKKAILDEYEKNNQHMKNSQ